MQMPLVPSVNLFHLLPLLPVRRRVFALQLPLLMVPTSALLQQLFHALLRFNKSDEVVLARVFVCRVGGFRLAFGHYLERTVEVVFR